LKKRKLGAEIIIGVDVQNLLDRDQLRKDVKNISPNYQSAIYRKDEEKNSKILIFI
jgi:hypothetical protein